MLIKDLIAELQALYDKEIQYVDVMGEPEIMIDVFSKIGDTHTFQYAGFDKNIVIDRSADGVYSILTAFVKEQ